MIPRKPRWPFVINRSCSLAHGLVGWWPMEPTSLLRTWDLSGKNNHGTLSGFTNVNGGGIDGGLSSAQFESSDESIATTFTTALTDFTVSAWFKSDGTASASSRICDKSYDVGFWMGHTTASSGDAIWGGGIMELGAPYGHYLTFPDFGWHHLIIRRVGTTKTVVGDGGRLSTSATVLGDALFTSQLYIGSSNSATNIFGGRISDVMIHNRGLSDAEITSMYAPATRWQLRWQPSGIVYAQIPAGGGGGATSPWNYYAQL